MKCMEICAEFDVKDRRYISAIDFAETHLADAPYFEFTDDEVSSVGDTITVSADRKVYQYFDDVTPVDLSIHYEFKGMQSVFSQLRAMTSILGNRGLLTI